MRLLTLALLLAAPLALAQVPSGTGVVPRAPQPAPAPQTQPPMPSPSLLPLAEIRARLAALTGKPLDPPQTAAIANGWKTALGEARITQNAYADRLAGITQLYRGHVLELLPPVDQVGGFDSAPLLPKLEKARGLPLTKEEKTAIHAADTARRAQAQQLATRMIETFAAALALPPDKVARTLTAAPAASGPPPAAPPARN